MAFYNTCSRCGANLDPGEHCDCKTEDTRRQAFFQKNMKVNPKTGQYSFQWDRRDMRYAEKTVS